MINLLCMLAILHFILCCLYVYMLMGLWLIVLNKYQYQYQYHILSILTRNSNYMMYVQINIKNDLHNALLQFIEILRVTYFTGLL